jgi:hypothetical protein
MGGVITDAILYSVRNSSIGTNSTRESMASVFGTSIINRNYLPIFDYIREGRPDGHFDY